MERAQLVEVREGCAEQMTKVREVGPDPCGSVGWASFAKRKATSSVPSEGTR